MTELICAEFDAASAARAAMQDLEVARIPSAVVQQGVRDRPVFRASVLVAVDEKHAPAVTGILNQYGPVELEERAVQS